MKAQVLIPTGWTKIPNGKMAKEGEDLWLDRHDMEWRVCLFDCPVLAGTYFIRKVQKKKPTPKRKAAK